MDTQIPTASLHYTNREFSKLDRFDDRVKFILLVLKFAYVLDPKLTPIPVDPIPEVGKTVDPMVISNIEKAKGSIQEIYGVLWNSSTRHMRKVLTNTLCLSVGLGV
uniref:Uncharacterized protein n=1 Tax=Lactuca sativa TaxID=4236 RepID=A0A9R1WAL1_LACSA|nr:hypothetical protein LSAT_V11C200096480 [Lactuca sativa]